MNAILAMSSFVFPLITFPYISRVLLPEGTGKINFATSIIAYFNMFAQLGIPTYGVKICAQVRDNREELTRTTQELLFINLVMAALSYIVLAIAIITIPKLREEKTLYLVISSTILLSAIGMEWLYKALEEYTYITIRSVAFKLLSVVAMFLLVKEQSDYVMYGAISVFASSASLICNFIKAREYIDFKWVGNYHPKRHFRVILLFFALACTTTVYTNLDNVMLGFIKTDADVGLYGAAVKIKNILVSIITSLGAVLLPRASYYIEQGRTTEFKEITKKALSFVVITAIPIAVYFIVFAKESILFIAGDAFANSILPMQIIMPTIVFIGITNVLGLEIMVPTGREKKVLISTIIGAAVDLMLNAILIPKYAAVGAAIGTLAAEMAVLMYQAFVLKDELKDAVKNIPYGTVFIGTIIAAIVSVQARKMGKGNFITLVISVILFMTVYGIVNIKSVKEFMGEMPVVKPVLDFVLNQKNRIAGYLIALALYMSRFIILYSTASSISSVQLLSKFVLLLTVAYVAFKLIIDFIQGCISRNKLIIMAIGLAFSLLYFIARGDKGIACMWLIICASHDVNFTNVAKTLSITVAVTTLLVMLCGVIGIIDNTIIVHMRNGIEMNRYGLGFDCYYTASHFAFYLTVLYTYYRKEKITWIELALLLILQIAVFSQTNTRNPFLVSILVLIAASIFKASQKARKYNPLYGIAATFIHPLCAVFIIGASLLYSEDSILLSKLNALFSNRIMLGNKAFNTLELNLFGQTIEWNSGSNYNIIDSSYVCALFEKGILLFALLMAIFVISGAASRKNRDSYFAIATVVTAIHGTFDTHLFSFPLNMFLIFMSYIFVGPQTETEGIGIKDSISRLYKWCREKLNPEILFFAGFALYTARKMWENTTFPQLITGKIGVIYVLVCLCLLVLKIVLFNTREKRKILVSAAMLIMGLFTYWKTTDLGLFILPMIIVSADGISFDRILKIWVAITGGILILAMMASIIGLIPNLQYTDHFFNGIEAVRNSFGIIYPTDFGAHVFFIVLSIFYLRRNKLSWIEYTAGTLIAVLMYVFCQTELDSGSILLTVILFGIGKFIDTHENTTIGNIWDELWKSIGCCSVPISALAMFALTMMYRAGGVLDGKGTLTSRFMLGKAGIEEYGIKLFGQQVDLIGAGRDINIDWNRYNYIDSSYIQLLVVQGFAYFIMILGIFTAICFKNKNNRYLLYAIALIAVNCMLAHHMIAIEYNAFMLALFAAVEHKEESSPDKA